ncbi:MAG TPA: response regulator transcription factor [Acidimicrobiales bacterium]|nr:response regulator transcription factor [Acidimicrobiales bacterium]
MSGPGADRTRTVACIPALTDELAAAGRLAGLLAEAAADVAVLAARLAAAPNDLAAVVVDATRCSPADAMAACKLLRRLDPPFAPILVVVALEQLDELSLRDELFDDFFVSSADPRELAARLRHVLVQSGSTATSSVVEHAELTVNLENYQATIAGRALDLTYMEYELLRFFATNPGRVLTRETLLNRVWGYEYYGGARTVDVHVRRLRAKLGEEHAHLISTVRSVGYRFG